MCEANRSIEPVGYTSLRGWTWKVRSALLEKSPQIWLMPKTRVTRWSHDALHILSRWYKVTIVGWASSLESLIPTGYVLHLLVWARLTGDWAKYKHAAWMRNFSGDSRKFIFNYSWASPRPSGTFLHFSFKANFLERRRDRSFPSGCLLLPE